MSIKQYPGGVITKNPTAPTTTVASGIWTVDQAQSYAKQGIWPRSPGAPTVGTATVSVLTASVPFTAPTDTGSAAITLYTATSSPSGIQGTSATSPISVSGLTNNTTYTFSVTATNGAGTGASSAQSNSVTPSISVPTAPTIGTATRGGSACASVTFTAPSCCGGAPITGYTGVSTPGCITGTSGSSPVVVSGLTVGTSYTFKVKATNAAGDSPLSSASNSITARIRGCALYSPGTYSWVAPTGVTSVSVVLVGGGGGAGGFYGSGTAGGDSSFNASVYAYGGKSSGGSGAGGGGTGGNGGGTGGNGQGSPGSGNPAGGGAAGYSGNGGNAGSTGSFGGGSGGGVGLYGQGTNGSGGSPNGSNGSGGGGGGGGGGSCFCGSAGQPGSCGSGTTYGGGYGGGTGGGMGGGGGGLRYGNNISVTPGNSYTVVAGARGSSGVYGANGGQGGVRIVWPGNSRTFPSTDVGYP